MKRTELLFEKTWNLGKDVDFIYKKFFKGFIDAINKDNYNFNPRSGDLIFGSIYGNELPSKIMKQAHEEKPVLIKIGCFEKGSFYKPSSNLISVSVNYSAFDLLKDKRGNFSAVESFLSKKQYELFKTEFQFQRLKATTYHELSHYLNDVYNNKHITKMLKKVNDKDVSQKQSRKIIFKGKKLISLTDYELDAQIHAFKQLRRSYRKKWEISSFEEIIKLDSSLSLIALETKSVNKYDEWKKYILKRLAKEKLLGKRMKYNF